MQIIKFFISFSLVLALGFAGCSSGGGGSSSSSDSDTTSETDTDNPIAYVGTASLEGSIDLGSQVAARDTSGTTTTSVRATTGDDVVKLYVVDNNGKQQDTNRTCETVKNDLLVTTGYSCKELADNQNYIVRYLKYLGDNRVLEMKSSAFIPADSILTKSKVDPVSTMVAESIINAVEEAITGVLGNSETVAKIIASVRKVITETIQTMVEKGIISVPSLVIETDGKTFEDFAGVSGTKNENLSQSVGTVLTDSNVSTYLGAAKSEVVGSSVSYMTKKEIIKAIFDQLEEGDGGAPEWIINYLGDQYDTIGTLNLTVGDMELSVANNLEVSVDDLSWMGLTLSDPTAVLTDLNTTIYNGIVNGSALQEAMQAISEYHTIKAIDPDDRNASAIELLNNFPPIVGELFSKDFATTLMASTKFQNTGQAVVYLLYLIDIYSVEKAQGILRNWLDSEGESYYDEQLRNGYFVDFNPMPVLAKVGVTDDVLRQYKGVTFDGEIQVETTTYWNDITNSEEEVGSIRIGINNSVWMGELETPTTDNVEANLTYPTQSGSTNTVTMKVGIDSGGYAQLKYSPWVDSCDWNTQDCFDENYLLTDHASGDYTISVKYDGDVVTKTFQNVFVLRDALQYAPKLTTPRPYPVWPSELNYVDVSSLTVGDSLYDSLQNFLLEEQAYWDDGGATIFDPAQDGGTNSTELENAVFKWKEANITAIKDDLPDNVIPGYQVSINRFYAANQTAADACYSGSWEDCNTDIFNTWWKI